MATRNPAVAKTSVPASFNNDTATDEQRTQYLEAHHATITGEDGAWVLEYKAGAQLLDAETYSDALFEACNIV